MAIGFVGSSTQGYAGTTSAISASLTALSGGSDSAPIDGDLVVVFYATGSTTTRTITVDTSGYTSLPLLQHDQGVYAANLVVAYKFMGSTPDTTVDMSGTGNVDDAGRVIIMAFRGVDPTTPMDVTQTTDYGGNLIPDPPSIAPVTAGALVVAVGAAGHNRSNVVSYSSPDLSNFISASSNDSQDVVIGAGTYQWTSGAFDPAVWTFSGATNGLSGWVAMTLALRPDPASGAVLLVWRRRRR